MKRKALELTLILGLLFSTSAFTLLVHVASANPFMPKGSYYGEPSPPSISVQSPSEKLHYWIGSDVWLDFTVTMPVTPWYETKSNDSSSGSYGTITQVTFSLDGLQAKDAIKISEHEGVNFYWSYSVNIGKLSAGNYTIVINAKGSGYYGDLNLTQDISLASNYSIIDAGAKTKLVSSSASINFIVDAVRPTTPPNITLLSPANTTYHYIRDWTHVPYVRLEYQAEDTRLSVGYSLDGDSNIIPVKNGTRLDIPIESRSLTLYANDTFGNSATPQTVYYEITRWIEPTPRFRTPPPPPPPTPNPTDHASPLPQETKQAEQTEAMAGAAIMAIAVVAGLGLLVHLIRRK